MSLPTSKGGAPMEPTDAARVHTEDQRFERPYALADRFLDNI